MLESIKNHALDCAQFELCTTPSLTAAALDMTPDRARDLLKMGADAGYFRSFLLPAGVLAGVKIGYQPTFKALKTLQKTGTVPPFLRAELKPAAKLRGLLRAHIRFSAHPNLQFCDADRPLQVPVKGYIKPIIGTDNTQKLHIFTPVLPSENPFLSVESSMNRWSICAENDPPDFNFELHFVTFEQSSESLNSVLTALTSNTTNSTKIELDALEQQIRDDKTGMAVLKLASKKRELQAQLAAQPQQSAAANYQWLNTNLEVLK